MLLTLSTSIQAQECTIGAYGDPLGQERWIDNWYGDNLFAFSVVMFTEDVVAAAACQLDLEGLAVDILLQLSSISKVKSLFHPWPAPRTVRNRSVAGFPDRIHDAVQSILGHQVAGETTHRPHAEEEKTQREKQAVEYVAHDQANSGQGHQGGTMATKKSVLVKCVTPPPKNQANTIARPA